MGPFKMNKLPRGCQVSRHTWKQALCHQIHHSTCGFEGQRAGGESLPSNPIITEALQAGKAQPSGLKECYCHKGWNTCLGTLGRSPTPTWGLGFSHCTAWTDTNIPCFCS